MTTNQLSYGGLIAAGALLILFAVRWWRQGFAVPSLASFASGLLSGLLLALCSGGILGWAAHALANATNHAGDLASGTNGEFLHRATPAGLDVGGGLIALVLFLVPVVVWRCSNRELRRELAAGGIVGSSLGLSGGVSGLAAVTFIPLVNHLGDHLMTLH